MADAPENNPEKQLPQDTEEDKATPESEDITLEANKGEGELTDEATKTTEDEQVESQENSLKNEDTIKQEESSPEEENNQVVSDTDMTSEDLSDSTLEGSTSESRQGDEETVNDSQSSNTEGTSSEALKPEEISSSESQSVDTNSSMVDAETDENEDQAPASETKTQESTTAEEGAEPEEVSSEQAEATALSLDKTIEDNSDKTEDIGAETDTSKQDPAGKTGDAEAVSKTHLEEGDADQDDGDSDDSSEEETPDYSQFSREELAREIEKIAKGDDVRSITDQIREIKVHFDELEEAERQKALEQFTKGGGEQEGFEYRPDEYYTLFYAAYDKIRERRSQHRAEREKERQQNLKLKEDILNRLRDFVDSEETQVSITKLKDIQQEWRSIGEVPSSHNRTLWANYNALLDRFYDNRSIYFELKELDRKKNLASKIAVAERAEQLVNEPDIKKATKELDELHEEYKHIGPVPRDEQETLWQRFKAASDKIHDRRRADIEAFKEQLKVNLVEKQKLVEQVKLFSIFESDSIKDWNKKTKEIQQLQKQWDSVGSMPRNQAKEVNREFWSSFKEFFAHKGEFFKRLDALREENLKKKEELVAKAESIKESEDWRATSNELKRLQREWKEIGPVPEKFRETVYQRFKAACDEFFERRRNNSQETEIEYQKNLKTREEICDKIEKLAKEKSSDLDAFADLTQQYSNTGFVPRGAIKVISERYQNAVNTFLANAQDLDDAQKQEVQVSIELGAMKSGPGAGRRINQKEGSIRRQISRLEDDIAVWKNNISFFTSSSKQADKLIADVERKIQKAGAELEQLKSQLNVLQSMKEN